MYASLTWDTHPGDGSLADLTTQLTQCFEDGRTVVWLLSNAVIFRVEHQLEYLQLNEAVQAVADQFEGQLHYAFFCHNARQPYRGIEHDQVDQDQIRGVVE